MEYEGNALVSLRFAAEAPPHTQRTECTDRAFAQVSAYLQGKRQSFSVPYILRGTAFQCAVWRMLCTVPYGETRSYGEIAAMLGKPGAARAVGAACRRNPLWLIVPCHRIVGAKGDLTGYAGGIARKQMLLMLERETARKGADPCLMNLTD